MQQRPACISCTDWACQAECHAAAGKCCGLFDHIVAIDQQMQIAHACDTKVCVFSLSFSDLAGVLQEPQVFKLTFGGTMGLLVTSIIAVLALAAKVRQYNENV